MNTADRYQKAVAIFQEVCDLPPDLRDAHLSSACGDDSELRRSVELLIQHDQNVCGAVAAGEQGDGIRALITPATDDKAPLPLRIGQYRIARKIGQGGMGIVYEAEQEHPRRTVALKVLYGGVGADGLLKRFRREADFLGRLQHPGIAHVFEAGVGDVETNSGISGRQPFIAMELIDGVPLGKWMRADDCTNRRRLELLVQVCDAVQHAHDRGVVHRDLKPANVFVNRDGQPKILDFGIARLVDAESTAATLQTMTGQLLGTIPYMSPEQVTGDSRLIDARTDVYALGVLMYEMLTGQLPYDLHHRSIAEAARVIREDEPTRLGHVNRTLRGDLETIASKALEKDRDRRYASAGALADDLKRYLTDEPILARPSSAMYQFRKFSRRNRALVGGVAATMLALAVGLGFALYGFFTASRERDMAQRERATSEAVTSFLAEMLAAVDPGQMGRDVTVRSVLDRAAADVGERFAGQPLVEAKLRRTIGETYVALGEYEQSEKHLTRAVALLSERLGEDHPRTLDARSSLGEVLYFRGRYADAETQFRKAKEGYRRVLPVGDHRILGSTSDLAFIAMQQGRLEEAEKGFLEARAIQKQNFSDDDPLSLELGTNLGSLYIGMGKLDKAEATLLEVIERSKRVRGPDHPETILAIANLASTYNFWDRPQDAEPLLRQCLEIQKRILGENHSKTLITLHNLGRALQKQQKFTESEALVREALPRSIKANGIEDRSTILLTENLATSCRGLHKWEETDRLFNEALRLNRRVYGDNSPPALAAQGLLVEFYIDRSRFDDATPIAEDLVQKSATAKKNKTIDRIRFQLNLAKCYTGLGRFEDAEQTLKGADESASSREKTRLIPTWVELYERWDRPHEAELWRKKLEDRANKKPELAAAP